jgi:light-regulated signal transduction histidine kinase (bacteriophytochrome)
LSNRKALIALKEALKMGEPHKVSTVNYKKNHEPIWINASINPVFNEKGMVVNWVGVQRNVTEDKKAEMKMATLHEDLIKQANKLEASNKELEHFAYIASHDLQEPLRMVTSFLGLLEKKYDGVLDVKGKQYLNFAIDGAKRMRQMVMDLLDYSRVGRLAANTEEVDLNTLVRDIIRYYNEKQEKDKKPTINVGKLPIIRGLKTPLMQVFQNLISNGIKYRRENVGSVININVKEQDDYWHFTVQDNGMGIKEEYFDKIFIIFQRLHTTEKVKGTGLGLAITKKIIETMGGKIWVESVVGEGSTFNFTISKIQTNGTS